MNRNFTILAVLFCVCLIASNIFETVIFTAGPLTLTGGFLVFPISYIINDCLSEVYGFKKTRLVILLAFAMNLFFVLMAQLVLALPEAPMAATLTAADAAGLSSAGGADLSEAASSVAMTPKGHFSYIFKADLRITCASMAAFLGGSLVNALVMVSMKRRQAASAASAADAAVRGFGWRAVVSSLAGESLDSLIFFPIAFWGVGLRNMVLLMVTQIVLKTAYEVVVLPLTTLVVRRLRTASPLA